MNLNTLFNSNKYIFKISTVKTNYFFYRNQKKTEVICFLYKNWNVVCPNMLPFVLNKSRVN